MLESVWVFTLDKEYFLKLITYCLDKDYEFFVKIIHNILKIFSFKKNKFMYN